MVIRCPGRCPVAPRGYLGDIPAEQLPPPRLSPTLIRRGGSDAKRILIFCALRKLGQTAEPTLISSPRQSGPPTLVEGPLLTPSWWEGGPLAAPPWGMGGSQ